MVDSEPLVEPSLSDDLIGGCSAVSAAGLPGLRELVSFREVYSPASSSAEVGGFSGAGWGLPLSRFSDGDSGGQRQKQFSCSFEMAALQPHVVLLFWSRAVVCMWNHSVNFVSFIFILNSTMLHRFMHYIQKTVSLENILNFPKLIAWCFPSNSFLHSSLGEVFTMLNKDLPLLDSTDGTHSHFSPFLQNRNR